MDCEYCHKTYVNKTVLQMHQRSAKKCLQLQGKTIGNKCKYCDEDFSVRSLSKHMMNCKERSNKLEQENLELKKQLKKKDEDLKELVMKVLSEPRTVINNNNVINNKYNCVVSNNFSVEGFREAIDKDYTQENFLQGQRGVAYFARNKLLIDKETGKLYYYCTDTGRKTFIMKDDKGNIVKDCKSVKLTELLLAGGLVKKSISHYLDILATLEEKQKGTEESIVSLNRKRMACVKNLSEIQDMDTNNVKFVSRLSALMCNPSSEENDVMYEIEIAEEDEEEEEEEEDISQYTDAYFNEQELKIEEFRGSAMYRRFRERFEKDKARVMMLRQNKIENQIQ